ncbi:hypothetical protein NDA13_000019 [Ustilago tritici]|nr:hypothetical protein NDA13_000019 [Ustilago tritici]
MIFFLMHLNNAHVFTPLYLSLFACSPSSLRLRSIFLRALLAQFLYYYISRGRTPAFPLELGLYRPSFLGTDVGGKEADSVEALFQRTAEQLIRIHRGEFKPSKYADEQGSRRGESVGAHQEFWSFEEFY